MPINVTGGIVILAIMIGLGVWPAVALVVAPTRRSRNYTIANLPYSNRDEYLIWLQTIQNLTGPAVGSAASTDHSQPQPQPHSQHHHPRVEIPEIPAIPVIHVDSRSHHHGG